MAQVQVEKIANVAEWNVKSEGKVIGKIITEWSAGEMTYVYYARGGSYYHGRPFQNLGAVIDSLEQLGASMIYVITEVYSDYDASSTIIRGYTADEGKAKAFCEDMRDREELADLNRREVGTITSAWLDKNPRPHFDHEAARKLDNRLNKLKQNTPKKLRDEAWQATVNAIESERLLKSIEWRDGMKEWEDRMQAHTDAFKQQKFTVQEVADMEKLQGNDWQYKATEEIL